MPKRKHGVISEAARFSGVSRATAHLVAHGKRPWRTARPSLVRALYAGGWSPEEPDGRRKVRTWLNDLSAVLAVEPMAGDTLTGG